VLVPALDLEQTRAYLARVTESPAMAATPALAIAALAHLDRLAARVVELEARVEALLAHEVRVADEWGEVLLGAHDEIAAVARELRDDEVTLYRRRAPAQCERAADRARRLEHASESLRLALSPR
jgi:hypothetical protein